MGDRRKKDGMWRSVWLIAATLLGLGCYASHRLPECEGGLASCDAGTRSDSAADADTAPDSGSAPTDCAPGSFVSAEPSSTSERVCAPCDAGTFSVSVNASSCEAWSACDFGTFVSLVGTSTTDRQCAPCPEGTGSWGENQPSCVSLAACPPGTYETMPGSVSTPPICAACNVGEYCAGASEPRLPCAAGTWDDDADPATRCAAARVCGPGTYVATEATPTTNSVCLGCTTGTFSAIDNATSCAPWRACVAGEYVVVAPDAAVDRQCAACAAGTFSDGPNRSVCLAEGACAPGTWQTAPATPTSGPVCEACSVGEYCAGGDAPPIPCRGQTWDDDDDPATACVPWTMCVAGTFVATSGDATHDRVCQPCASGSFSDHANASACTLFTECGPIDVDQGGGSATSDRVCMVSGWSQNFGSAAEDSAMAVAVDLAGNVNVAGYTLGTFPGQTSAGGRDAFVRSYDKASHLRWTRQFGSAGDDLGLAVGVDSLGNVYVGTTRNLTDASIHKFDSGGRELWTRSVRVEAGRSMALQVVPSGDFYLVDGTDEALPGQTSAGGRDAFVRKYDSAGRELWVREFGTADADNAVEVSADASGNVYVLAWSSAAAPPAVAVLSFSVRAYDSAGTLLWANDFVPREDPPGFMAVDGAGDTCLAGSTDSALPGQTSAGMVDSFAELLTPTGADAWTHQFGGSDSDGVNTMGASADGRFYIAGTTRGSDGAWNGSPVEGTGFNFVRAYDSEGTVLWTRRFWTVNQNYPRDIAVGPRGGVYIVGGFSGRGSVGALDGFLFRFNG
ncbi:MAG: hypothetical protein GXP55_05250 [Deltaproteobacteria bacterium]|nr:hypothetical protein [Deltaproteobacteria bacterium]